MLNDEEILRYKRQTILPEIGLAGQKKLKKSAVLVFGCGGLASSVLPYLTSCGVGRIGLIDYDQLELSNLNRQVIFQKKDIGKYKATLASQAMQALNPDLKTKVYPSKPDIDVLTRLLKDYDCLVDATDNLSAKLLANQACFASKKPLFYAAIKGWDGQLSNFDYELGPCLACLLGMDPVSQNGIPNGNSTLNPVVGVTCGVVGSMQAVQVIKYILGLDLEFNQLWLVGSKNLNIYKISLKKNPECIICRSRL